MNKNLNVKYLMLVLTFVDMIIMAVFLLVLSSNSTKKSVSINNSIIESLTTEEETEELSTEEVIAAEEIISEPQIISKEDYMSDKNTSKITSIYARQIIGNFNLANGMWFDFEPDGVFNGFFDYNSPSITNGYYEIITVDENPILNIYNSEMTAKVSYSLLINNYHVILYYEAAGINIELNNDN
ncbi:MAG: hypothetical protein PHX08_07230 [Lachnospiraceae bacterium]|nr:hypothetical protein [Lachnospiraceae bacterium]